MWTSASPWLAAAKDLFGTDGEEVDLSTFNPKSEKEFVKFGTLLSAKFLSPVETSGFYKEAGAYTCSR